MDRTEKQLLANEVEAAFDGQWVGIDICEWCGEYFVMFRVKDFLPPGAAPSDLNLSGAARQQAIVASSEACQEFFDEHLDTCRPDLADPAAVKEWLTR